MASMNNSSHKKPSLQMYLADLEGYRLLDSGEGYKLEEVSGVRIIRSEPKAWWKKTLPQAEWDKTIALRKREKQSSPVYLNICDNLRVTIRFQDNSKHIGIFPEQSSQWDWIHKTISSRVGAGDEIHMLNLFGYTGAGTLAAASAGAKVTHVDGSRAAISWARENQEASGFKDAPIRWILDDALAFVKREIKRGVRYDAILLDPPSYGRGSKGEVWKVEDDLTTLLELCRKILSDKPLFIILNMYSTELSSISLGNLLSDMTEGGGGHIDMGELAIQQENSSRLLPLSIFARWAD